MSTPARRMFRYVVPVDDRNHEIALQGDPVAVAVCQARTGNGGQAVEFWAEHIGDTGYAAHSMLRYFRVFGTGHLLPRNARWAGTCPRTELGLVWHLYEIDFEAPAGSDAL